MKKTLLSLALISSGILGANAYWLPNPVITSEKIEGDKATIEWTYDSSIEMNTGFQVIVYKMHKATAEERFVLASADFMDIESTGTLSAHEERGALWDYVKGAPGWIVRCPLYMNSAIGIDAIQYFPGSDNSDIFGGAYMISPDYDLSKVSSNVLEVKAQIANEATSVTGGFCIWAWNTNWYTESNIDYKPVYGMDYHYDGLSNQSWKDISESPIFPDLSDYTDPDQIEEINSICMDRTRVMFYGSGKSAYWINNFEVAANLQPGDMIDYAAEMHKVEGNSFVIDLSKDTDNDYVYAYEIHAIREDFDDYRNVTTYRAINYPYNTPKNVFGQLTGIEDVTLEESNVAITTDGNNIIIKGAEGLDAQVYTAAGACVYNGPSDRAINLAGGIYIVKAGQKTAKVAL